MFDFHSIKKIIYLYNKIFPTEKKLDFTKDFLKVEQNLISRKNFPAHITTSAIVFNQNLTEILVIKHKNLNKAFQPGGHVEESDKNFYSAAKRELEEETGYKNVIFVPLNKKMPDLPIDIDIHQIPENPNKNEPKHLHIDFRYLFILQDSEDGFYNAEETKGFFWKPWKSFTEEDNDLYRVIHKAIKIINKKKDQIFFTELTKKFEINLKEYNLIAVLHIVPDILYFIQCLKDIFAEIKIIPKRNSLSKKIKNRLPKNIFLDLTRQDLKNNQVIKKIFSNDNKTLIIDIGGYFATNEFFKYNKVNKKVIGIIEDTLNGHHKYEKIKEIINIPIISVAKSELKANEDDLVGYSIAYYTEFITRKSRILPKYVNCGIIGYGKLGIGIAKYLFNQNIKPYVYDINPIKQVLAFRDGCIPVKKEYLLKNCDLIFCATGNQSINIDEFKYIKQGSHIASVTSSDSEFGITDFNKYFKTKELNKYLLKIETENNYWYMINSGNAVNFIDKNGDRVSNFIRLIQAEIICGLNYITKKKLNNKTISEIDMEDKLKIADLFLNLYAYNRI